MILPQLVIAFVLAAGLSPHAAARTAGVAVNPESRLTDLSVERGPGGQPRFTFEGRPLTPHQLADALEASARAHTTRGPLYRLLNITSPVGVAWVGLGLLGQVLFTGRMVVQWLTSERAKQSVVPPAFWWMSLGGAAMLLAYFAWRKDIVGLIGQGAGFLIYARNLWLLRTARPTPPTDAPEPPDADPASP